MRLSVFAEGRSISGLNSTRISGDSMNVNGSALRITYLTRYFLASSGDGLAGSFATPLQNRTEQSRINTTYQDEDRSRSQSQSVGETQRGKWKRTPAAGGLNLWRQLWLGNQFVGY